MKEVYCKDCIYCDDDCAFYDGQKENRTWTIDCKHPDNIKIDYYGQEYCIKECHEINKNKDCEWYKNTYK